MRPLIIALLCAAPAFAAPISPAGKWITIDDDSKKPKAVVEIREEDGKITGNIVSLFLEPGENPQPVCDKCRGELKGKPTIGMRILWDLKATDELWDDGKILDPENGKTYDCKMEVLEGGQKLKVRGYIGLAMFGRNQVWERQEPVRDAASSPLQKK